VIVKGKMRPFERDRVLEFVRQIKGREIKVAKGDLARSLQVAINAQRPREFYEKLISRRKLNKSLGPFLMPRVPRRIKKAVIELAIARG